MSLLLLFEGDAGVTGTGAITLGSFTVAGAGGAGPSGTGSITLGSFTVSGSGTASLPATTTGCDHLNEDGGLNLNEDGGIAILEGCPAVPPTPPADLSTPGGGNKGRKHDPSPETQAYWESERGRLAVLRDDEEVLVLV